MTTTLTNQPQKRIFTIAGRHSIAVVTDSKIPEGKTSGTLRKLEAETTPLACLRLLNEELDRMPKHVKLSFRVAFLLPSCISFLSYKDTREFWLTYGYKKNDFNPETKQIKSYVNSETGEVTTAQPIDPLLLEEVRKLDELLLLQNENVQIFRQENLTSPLYNSYKQVTWNMLDKYVPAETVNGEQVVSCFY